MAYLEEVTVITVEVHTPIRSNTHTSYALDCPPYAAIREETHQGGEQVHVLHGRFEVSDHFMLDTWPVVDSFLTAVSLVGDGVFSRHIWTVRSVYSDVRPVGSMPRELRMPGAGIRVVPIHHLEPADGTAYRDAFECIRDRVAGDPDAMTILTFYTVSNWLFNADMIREAGMNYFSVVEAVLTRLTGQPRGKSLWGIGKLTGAAKQVHIDQTGIAAIETAAHARNDLAHGRLDNLIHSQHVLGSHPATSPSLRVPALDCKQAADVAMRRYFRL